MTLSTNFSPNSRDELPLCATAAISLDLTPVAQAIASVNSGIREEGAASRKRVSELATIVSSLNNDINQNSKLLVGIQQCIGSLEEEQRRLSDQSVRLRFIKPLAQKLLGLRAGVRDFMSKEDFAFVATAIEDLLGDFEVELLTPEVGEPFDAKYMRPRAERIGRKSLDLLVREILLPGAKYNGHLLQLAEVKLIDRASYLALHERQEGSPFPSLRA